MIRHKRENRTHCSCQTLTKYYLLSNNRMNRHPYCKHLFDILCLSTELDKSWVNVCQEKAIQNSIIKTLFEISNFNHFQWSKWCKIFFLYYYCLLYYKNREWAWLLSVSSWVLLPHSVYIYIDSSNSISHKIISLFTNKLFCIVQFDNTHRGFSLFHCHVHPDLAKLWTLCHDLKNINWYLLLCADT